MNKNLDALLQGLEEDTNDLFQVIDAVKSTEDFAQCAQSIDPMSKDWVLLCNELSDLYMEFHNQYC